jgi:hypothetical protein
MLIWPEPGRVLDDARENGKKLSREAARVQGVALSEARAKAREFLGHREIDKPLVATGHQAELYHPGVWVKNAFIHSAAKRLGGEAYHFAVDTDAPKHLHLRWPGASRPITDDDRLTTAAWTGLLAAPTPQHLSYVQVNFDEAAGAWPFEPAIDPFFESLRRLSLESPDLASAIVNSSHLLEWDLGLRHHVLLTGSMWNAEPYLLYVHHIAARAREFAGAYNAALAAYRQRHGIRTNARPMPDLRLAEDEVELPFWVDDLENGERARGAARRVNGQWQIEAGGAPFGLNPAAEGWDAARRLAEWCRRGRVRITPRALTLTMYLRLFVADQFVHGIGGGRYDQVTDEVVAKFFGVEPPSFSVTTATLYFPLAAGQRRINLRPLWQESRRVRHGLLSPAKRELVAAIDAAPRGSRQRREAFFEMHRKLAAESNAPAVREWERKLREAEQESQRQTVLFDRELFFAIQPRDRLLGMIERYDGAFEGEVHAIASGNE